MILTCLMPTYGRPRHILENAVACFLMQDYPPDRRRLLIYDDGGTLPHGLYVAPGVDVLASNQRADSLPAKYDTLWPLDGADAFVVWDDDDLYLPWHLSAHAATLESHGWSHPSHVWSTYTGVPEQEQAAGRFHGALAVRRELLVRLGGWLGVMPIHQTRRADFDQRMIAALAAHEPPGDPVRYNGSPSYVFRWADTGASHCQGRMRSPDDETWWTTAPPPSGEVIAALTPRLDAYAGQTLRGLVRMHA